MDRAHHVEPILVYQGVTWQPPEGDLLNSGNRLELWELVQQLSGIQPFPSLDVPGEIQSVLADGIDVELDQFHTDEIIDWPRWCNEQTSREHSDFVLCVCTAEYYRRIEGSV